MAIATPKQAILARQYVNDVAALRAQLTAGALNSDHAPLTCDVPNCGTVVTYNIMTRMRAEGANTNNGFGLAETGEAYEARLRRIAAELGEMARDGAAAMLLQEVPVEPRLFALLSEKLPVAWRALSVATRGETFAQGILYASLRLQAAPVTGNVALGPQTGRVQLATLSDRNDVSATVANVHLEWGQPCDDLMSLGHLPGAKVIAGDFNRPPGSVPVSGARYLIPDGPTSFKYSDGRSEMNEVDGFILTPAEPGPTPVYLGYSLLYERDIGDLLRALNRSGPWQWHTAESTWHGEYLNVRPMPGVRVQIRGATGNYDVSAAVHPNCAMSRDEIDAIIRRLLSEVAISGSAAR